MRKYTTEELLLIWLDSIIGLEYNKKRDLYEKLQGKNGIRKAVEDNKNEIVSAFGEENYQKIFSSANRDYSNRVLAELSESGVIAVTEESADYPTELLNVELRPFVLYCKGDVSLLSTEKFAVVGSRKSLPVSIALAEDFADKLCRAGYTLISGHAEGVDGAALKSALASGGKCISVIAGGFDNIYPANNRSLIEEVAKNGLIVSENPPTVSPLPYFFPIRNRIIAALSQGVLVVSAGVKSGAIYTAEYAMEYGKDVFAVPYNVGVPSGAGCNDLIKRGAFLTDNFSDIADFYGFNGGETAIELSDDEKAVISAIGDGAHVDKICEILNKRIFEITPILSALEIKGAIIKSGFNEYSLLTVPTEE